MALKRSLVAAFAILICLMFAWATGAGRPYPASAGGVIDPTCVSSLPCIEYDNNGTGPAIRGVALKVNGIAGWTKANSTSTANGRSGIFGDDLSTSGTFNSGVSGLSVRGTGVLGNSMSGAGVLGLGSIGIEGDNTSSATSDAVFAKGVGGRLFRGNNSHSVDVFTVDDGGNTGINSFPDSNTSLTIGFGTSFNNGIVSRGNITGVSGAGLSIGVEGAAESMSATAVRAFGGGGLVYEGISTAGRQVFTVDDGGNVHAHSFTANLAAATGQKVVTYAPQASEPTIEDFGEAQLTNGSAYVQFDGRFAGTMARGLSYLVFITPEGMTHGTLCVTQRTASGFTVQENQGGRSSVTFAYRIVAKPFGSQAPRLPLLVEHRVPKLVPRLHN